VRASMALRGVRPSIDDLRAVQADPSRLPDLVDGYLASPEFGTTVRELHNEALLLRIQRPDYTPLPGGTIANRSFEEVARSVYDEPLRLIEDVVMSDRPYTEIVTADYVMANGIVATVWGMPHSTSDNWERTTWPDGRPAAGILVSPALPLRYRSTAMNHNRGRANALARGLLCHDFLDGDVKIDGSVNLVDPSAVADALVKNPSCAACHQTLDPLASYFAVYAQGTSGISGESRYPVTWYYSPSSATDWFTTTYRPPAYFGHDAEGLDGLGRAIATDPRFARCAAIHFASYLTQVPEHDLPRQWIAELHDGFTASGYSAKQLAKAVVLSDRFRVSHDNDLMQAEGVVGYQKVRPQQLGRMLKDLTGFEWTSNHSENFGAWRIGQVDYLDDDIAGFRVLAGGIDSFMVNKPVHTMSPTSSLVVQRAAYLAAKYAIDHADSPLGIDPTLIDEPSVRAQLAVLHARIFGELAPDLEPSAALFRRAFEASGDAKRAWVVTLTAMLSDLRAVYY
jgi:hypothetical protein